MSEQTEAMASESPAQEVEVVELPPIIPPERLPVCQKEELSDEAIRQVLGYKGMILASPTDKDGYLKVMGAHKFAKVVAAKIKSSCLEGRRPALKEQEEWIKFEKELLSKVEPITKELEKQREIYEAAEKIRKEDEQKKARLKIQARLDSLSSIGRRADYDKATTFTDEQWDAFFVTEKAAWETENAQRAADEKKRQTGELRKAELSEFGVVVVAADAAELPEENYQTILADAKKAFEAEQARKLREADEKKAKDTRYRVRVAALMALEVAVGPEDIQTVYDMADEDWNNYIADETEAFNIRVKEKAEEARLDSQLRDRLQAMAGFVARAISPEESAAIRAMPDTDWTAFLARVKTAHEEKQRLEAEERKKDDTLRSRMATLSTYGTVINTELGTRLREMPDEEWETFLGSEKTAYDERQAEQVRLQEALAAKPVPAPVVALPPVEDVNVQVQHLLDSGFIVADVVENEAVLIHAAPEATSEDDIIKSWLDLLADTVRILPTHSNPAIVSRLQATQAGVMDILRDLWHYEKTEKESA